MIGKTSLMMRNIDYVAAPASIHFKLDGFSIVCIVIALASLAFIGA